MSQNQNAGSPFGGSNDGNIWPWKFSIFGLVLILVLLGAIAYRHYTLKAPLGFEDPAEQLKQKDTTTTDPLSR